MAQWGNGLAVRLPTTVVEALDLKPGDNIEIHVAGERAFAVEKPPGARELLAGLRKYVAGYPPISSSTGWTRMNENRIINLRRKCGKIRHNRLTCCAVIVKSTG
jgi:antitoxin MazE